MVRFSEVRIALCVLVLFFAERITLFYLDWPFRQVLILFVLGSWFFSIPMVLTTLVAWLFVDFGVLSMFFGHPMHGFEPYVRNTAVASFAAAPFVVLGVRRCLRSLSNTPDAARIFIIYWVSLSCWSASILLCESEKFPWTLGAYASGAAVFFALVALVRTRSPVVALGTSFLTLSSIFGLSCPHPWIFFLDLLSRSWLTVALFLILTKIQTFYARFQRSKSEIV